MRGKFIWTSTNRKFYPLDPRDEEVDLEDIAHALSHLCRANGHFRTFYSVAQHSINCAGEAKARGLSNRIQLACLLHDASEAYIADLSRAVKPYLSEYLKIEDQIQRVIYNAFHLGDLTGDELFLVKEIDDALLHHEFVNLHYQGIYNDSPMLHSVPDFTERSFSDVKERFARTASSILAAENNIGEPFKTVGIDGCQNGWAVFWISSDGNYGYQRYGNIEAALSDHGDAKIVLIDIPIGLPENEDEAVKRPDAEVRKRLKGKAPSIFNTPCRQAVDCVEKHQAKAENQKHLGKSLSEQSLGIMPKIREVDSFLHKNPQFSEGRARESHPEYAFMVLNNGMPLLSRKSEPAGRQDRLDVLNRYFPQSARALTEIGKTYPNAMLTDFLDAMALAVTGLMGCVFGFETVPDHPEKDSRGLTMEIVACRVARED